MTDVSYQPIKNPNNIFFLIFTFRPNGQLHRKNSLMFLGFVKFDTRIDTRIDTVTHIHPYEIVF